MIKQLNLNRSTRPNLILFTRWDRFSRNTANAYYTITQLQKIGIESQATDQPLDMSIQSIIGDVHRHSRSRE